MKINEAEQLLGITKANIRFYEKEGLLTPSRNESGYREYSDTDIARLKQIVILRKLGIPVQQIADILDGVLPLQDALDDNIASLSAQIDALNGALALTNQLRSENAETLDTDRYWTLIQTQESQGLSFYALVDDYLKFTEVNYEWFLWPLPGSALRKPWTVAIYGILLSALTALNSVLSGKPFLPAFFHQFFNFVRGFLMWTAIFIPIYLLSRRNKKAAGWIMNALLIAVPIAAVAAICIAMYMAFDT